MERSNALKTKQFLSINQELHKMYCELGDRVTVLSELFG